MAYNQFTLQRVVADFGLTLCSVTDLYPDAVPQPVPAAYRHNLARNTRLATTIHTEAARAQLLIGPLMAEVWAAAADRIALFVGTRFDVDESVGLAGVCDYILGRPPQLHYVTTPVMMIVEAKNDDVPGGLGQCAAAMVAAQRFNSARPPAPTVIHGAVTDGERWRFLRLTDARLDIELGDRPIADPDRLFGVLLHAVGVAPTVSPAAA
jgi:hypothetical protein